MPKKRQQNHLAHRTQGLNSSTTKSTVLLLPKNTKSRLQPLDARIIRAFQLKYRKLLIRYIISNVDDDKLTSDIINEIDILKVGLDWIIWLD